MPIYEYQCKKCKHRFEKIQSFSERPVKKCPECGGPVEKLIHAPAVQFKGQGWYVTDYAKKSGGPAKPSGDGDSADTATEKPASTDSKEGKPEKQAKKKP